MKVIKLRGEIWLSAGKDGQCWGYTFLFLADQGNPVSNSLLQRPYILFSFEPTEIFSRFLLLASTLSVFRGVICNAGVMHCLLIGITSCGCWGWAQRASEPERESVSDRQTIRERERQTDRPTKLIFIIKTAALGPFGQPVLCILQTQLSTNEQYVKTLQTDN